MKVCLRGLSRDTIKPHTHTHAHARQQTFQRRVSTSPECFCLSFKFPAVLTSTQSEMDWCEVPWQPVCVYSLMPWQRRGGRETWGVHQQHTFSFCHPLPCNVNTLSTCIENHVVQRRKGSLAEEKFLELQ